MRIFLRPLAGATLGAGAMALWIAYVNRPLVERFTIVYRGKAMTAYGAKGWRRDPGHDTVYFVE